MYFNMDEWSAEIIQAKDRRFLPVLYFPCLEITGYAVDETVHDGKKMAETMAATIKRYPSMIGAMTGMDLTVDAEAFGAKVRFAPDAVPAVDTQLVSSMEEAQALAVPDAHAGRVDIFLDAVVEAQKLITDRPIFGGQLGPFSLAANLLEITQAMEFTVEEPEIVHEVLRKSTEFLISRALAYKEAGANGILLAEPTAGLLSPKAAAEFSDQYVKQLVDAVQDSSFYVILHDCGNVTAMTDGMYGTGAKGLHFGNIVNMAQICSQIPQDVLVFGNVNPAQVFRSTPEELKKISTDILESCAQYPHYVFSTGCDVPPNSPLENIQAIVDACDEFNQRHGLI